MKAQFEKIAAPLENSFKSFIYENERFDAPWHFHPEFELTYIEKGKGIRYVGNNIQKFEEGDFVLIGTNLPHCWKNTETNVGDVKSIIFQWDENLLGADWILKSEFSEIKNLLKRASKGIKFPYNIAQRYPERLKSILKQSPFKKMISFLEFLEELSQIKEFELLCSPNFTPILNRKATNRIETVYHFVRHNYDKKIKLSDVSSLVSMSDEAFCRFFKKSFNKSFFTFINEYRINLACKMLSETNKQVSQIAYECGYESLPFFYKQFQKFMNCSPLIFKKEGAKVNA
ncbi:AraC family transcriptional regulator [Flavivirga eckloniae]|uniref:AraC family transcriptional regulator n=1 Tax=Flavivirga eckloniae TaxID=1803846 RepID=A0A2K9PYP9_9FLAO|nr:AraC family transcriptional regulator [Flavivirga eckloniae]AUP81677.1 AraC family transcriptional regulator [Flavivirga eckloniae]